MNFVDAWPLPIYCERSTSGILAEPLNLFTNLFYVGSALLAHRELGTASVIHRGLIRFLILMIAVVGVDSSAFHAIPSHFTLLLDALPIYIFMLTALVFFLKWLTQTWAYAVALSAAFDGLLVLVSVYVPASFL